MSRKHEQKERVVYIFGYPAVWQEGPNVVLPESACKKLAMS